MKTALLSPSDRETFAAFARRQAIRREAFTYSLFETAQVLGVALPTLHEMLVRRELHTEPGLRGERISKRQLLNYVSHRPTPVNESLTDQPSSLAR